MSAYLERLTWVEAAGWLTPERIVLFPLGAAAKEHGPHLPLDNDRTMAEYFARRVAQTADVIVAPTVAYHYYPAFAEYPGSTTLRLETAQGGVKQLAALQRAFQRHVYRPARAMEHAVLATPRASAARRLSIYADAYRSRLVEALAKDYPALQALLGEDEFSKLMLAFIASVAHQHQDFLP